jgi:hypothetical protein
MTTPQVRYSHYKSARAEMSPAEKAKQDRRIARYVKQGMCVGELMRVFRLPEARIRDVAEAFGLTLVDGRRLAKRRGR